MSKKVFIDTNVLLDFVLCRDGDELAMDIFQMGEEAKIQLCVSFLTMANVAYVARKHRTKEELFTYLRDFASMFEILAMDDSQYKEALKYQATDFEDMLQYQCASSHNCDLIITNNIKHFKFSLMPVNTPLEFLAEYDQRANN